MTCLLLTDRIQQTRGRLQGGQCAESDHVKSALLQHQHFRWFHPNVAFNEASPSADAVLVDNDSHMNVYLTCR